MFKDHIIIHLPSCKHCIGSNIFNLKFVFENFLCVYCRYMISIHFPLDSGSNSCNIGSISLEFITSSLIVIITHSFIRTHTHTPSPLAVALTSTCFRLSTWNWVSYQNVCPSERLLHVLGADTDCLLLCA